MSKTYQIVVTREGDHWLADVPELAGTHTYAKTLAALDDNIREAIALVEDLPEGAEATLELVFDVHTGDPAIDQATARVRAERERLRRAERELADETAQLARKMRADWSVRDCAALLGVSMQRVSQIAPDAPGVRRRRSTAA